MMFKQLSYFHTLAEDISNLAHSSQQLIQLLAHAYSSTSQPFCTIDAQIDNIIQQEQLLQTTLANIDLQVASNTFVPERLDQLQLSQIEPSQAQLPNWLPFVLDQEYACYRLQLNAYALELLKTHRLDEKRKALSKQRQDLMDLQARSVGMGLKGFEGIDLLEEGAHIRDRIKHVRKAYQYFCSQISRKIVEFVRQVIAKSKNFHKNTYSPLTKPITGFDHSQRRAEPGILASRPPRQPKQEYKKVNQTKILEEQHWYKPDPEIVKSRTYLYSPQPQITTSNYSPRHHTRLHQHQHYYAKSKQMRTQTTQPDYSTPIQSNYITPIQPYSIVSNNQITTDGSRWNQDSMHHCQNHHNHYHKSPKAHQHTCFSKAVKFSRVSSAQKGLVSSPRSKVFDYRTVIRNDYVM